LRRRRAGAGRWGLSQLKKISIFFSGFFSFQPLPSGNLFPHAAHLVNPFPQTAHSVGPLPIKKNSIFFQVFFVSTFAEWKFISIGGSLSESISTDGSLSEPRFPQAVQKQSSVLWSHFHWAPAQTVLKNASENGYRPACIVCVCTSDIPLSVYPAYQLLPMTSWTHPGISLYKS
jgi:hypothetical protein